MNHFLLNALSESVRNPHSAPKDQRYDLYDQIRAEAAKAGEEEEGSQNLTQLGSAGSIISALQPIVIDKELEKDYNRFFFPPKSDRSRFAVLIRSVAEVAVNFNYFYSFLRVLMSQGRHIAALEGTDQLASFIQSEAARIYSYMELELSGSATAMTESVGDALMSIMAGRFYMRSSQVYSGGFDVVTRGGTRDVSRLAGLELGNEGLLPTFTTDFGYESERLEAYSCETNLKVLQAAEDIISEVFGGGATANGAAAIEAVLPLSYKFTDLQQLFETAVGVQLPVQFFGRIDYRAPKGIDPNQFVRAVLVLAPENKVSVKLRQSLTEVARDTTEGDPLDSMPNLLHMATRDESRESRLLNRAVGGTLAFTFNKELSRYISQMDTPSEAGIHSWFQIWGSQFLRRAGRSSRAKGAVRVGRIRSSRIPRFTLPVSQLKEVTKLRKSIGMSVENTRANEDGLFFSTDGTLSSMPSMEQREQFDQLERFEALSKELAELKARYGVHGTLFSQRLVDASLAGMPRVDFERGVAISKELEEFEGSLLYYDWDYGLKFYSNSEGLITCVKEPGATKPHDLSVAALLGYNMGGEGEMDVRSFSDAVHLATNPDPTNIDGTPADLFGNRSEPSRFLKTGIFDNVFRLWHHYTLNDTHEGVRLPNLQTLVHNAMKTLGYETLNRETPHEQGTLYGMIISGEDGTLRTFRSPEAELTSARQLVTIAIDACCSGELGSVVHREAYAENGPEDLQAAIEDHPLYFMPSQSPMKDLSKVYKTLGGQVLRQILASVQGLSNETINSTKTKSEIKYKVEGEEGDYRYESRRPASGAVYSTLKPLATLMGKYVDDYEQWEARASTAIDSISRNENLDEDDMHFAGNNGKFAMFPHQLDTQRSLRGPVPPSFAVLDIRPGGGKTSIGIVDMAAITSDMQATGKRVRPLIICPDGLIRNWCDDIAGFTGENWNVIPINSSVLARWGYDRLVQILRDAPINTMVVVGMQFLCNNRVPVVFGSTLVESGFNLELIKSVGFNYIIIDESHKLKTLTSMRHRMIKQLTTAGFVDYLRLATGTLISDRVTDIEGQSALYSPVIFRSKELASALSNGEADDATVNLNGEVVDLWKVDTPQKARQRLSKYAAVITKAKKEWAFMLPSPLETFHPVSIVSTEDEVRDYELGKLHRDLYDMVVAQSIEELQALIKQAKGKKVQLQDDDDDDDSEDEDENEDNEEGGAISLEAGDELGLVNEAMVRAYLQRIERLIIAPEQDPAFETVFGAAGVTTYRSRKAKYIANIVKKHFDVRAWSKDGHYNEYDLVEFEGQNYLARKVNTEVPNRMKLDLDSRGIPPSEAPQYWRKEPEGKIIIFCRYTHSTEAVFDALGEFQKDAVKFTGQEKDKWANLDAFKYDPKVKILVANEMGMSEGHNLQVASRLIRVEAPWGPGELDQSASRIFRPDPAGAQGGNIYREVVFLDWVLADNTMEVPKMCRLIAKIFDASRFDEANNPKFDSVLQHHLPEVSLSLDVIGSRSSLSDYDDYVDAYAELNGVRNNEFHEMRANTPAAMIPIPEYETIPGSAKIANTPYVAAQKIPDPEGIKPEPLSLWMRKPDNAEVLLDPDAVLPGTPVITDQGRGMIVNVNKRYEDVLDADGNKVKGEDGKVLRRLNPSSPITSVEIRLKGNPELLRFNQLGVVFIPTKLSSKKKAEEFEVDLLYRKSDIRKREREQERLAKLHAEAEEKEREEQARKTKTESRLRKRVKDKKAAEVDANTRRKNLKEGKPINTGVDRKSKPKVVSNVGRIPEAEVEVRPPLELHPAYFHGYLTLETDDLDYEKELKKFKFKRIKDYVFVEVARRNQANAVMDYIEENFHLSDATADRLGEVFKVFEKGKRGMYNLELAPAHSLPHFFTVSKRMVKDRKEARLYPFFKDDLLIIACDLATCPVMKRHIGKAIPGAATSWKLSPGALVAFVKNKTEIKNLARQIAKSGIEIAEPKELQAEIARINFRQARKPTKSK